VAVEAERFVIDASAVVALLRGEPGGEMLPAYLAGGVMSVVNLAETVQVLRRYNLDPDVLIPILTEGGLRIVDADIQLARLAGELEQATRHAGLSLGDRFCFALALQKGLPVVATDRPFMASGLAVEVKLLR